MECSFEETDDKHLEMGDDLEMLREDLIGELQATNQYQEHIEALEDEEALATLEHIIAEEKGPVAELVKLIESLDPVQAGKLRKEDL